mgnify:CR=1 FL=1
MKKNETIEMMKYIKTNYEFFEITEEKINVWYETLKAYTFNDVLNNLKKDLEKFNVIFDNWWKATLNKASQDNVKLEFSHPSMALIILN